ncbi:MAG: dihydroorotase [Bacteroidota bacterium]
MLLIKNAKILSPGTPHHGKKRDLSIDRKGRIQSIRAKLDEKRSKVLDVRGAYVSPGWMDVGVQVGDPGFEHREDLQSVAAAAAAGGFTALAPQPNTHPTIHSKSEVRYLRDGLRDSLIDLYPLGAVSQSCEGGDITEIYDMHRAGAIAFTDGQQSIQDGGLMMRALQYVKAIDGIVINAPHDESIAGRGQIHEGQMSTALGMKGLPALAEELMLQRDLYLLAYTDSRLHVANVSTAGAVALIREAKRKGLRVTASVPAMNLALTEEVLEGFDTNYKVLPPLREKSDLLALRRGIQDGTLDFVSSNHTPLEGEAKKLEFPYADFGALGLQTLFPLVNTHLGDRFKAEDWVRLLAFRPREVFGLAVPEIREKEMANLTIFSTEAEWTFEAQAIRSKSSNTPFLGQSFRGKVLGVVNKGQSVLF